MGGMMGLPPQVLQALMQQMQQGQKPPQGAPQGGQPGPGPMPQIPPGQMPQGMQPPQGGQPQAPQFQAGDSSMMLPGGTASPAIKGIPMSATPPNQKPQLTGTGIIGSVLEIKNNMQNQKTQKARALASQQLALLQNPQMKKAMEDSAKKDPAIAKALEKQQKEWVKIYDKAMTDPNSPEYNGVQMAYRDLIGQEQQEQKMQQMQAQTEAQRSLADQRDALAQREKAMAAEAGKKTEQMGTVTEVERYKQEQKMQQINTQIKGRLAQTQQSTAAMLQAVKMRVEGQITSSKIRAAGTVRAAHERAGKIDTYIIQEYKTLGQQATELDRQAKDLQAHLDKETHWYSDPDDKAEVQAQLAQIEAQRGVLAQQFQMLQQKDRAFQSSGVTPPPQPKGSGTQSDPYVIP